MAVAEIGSRGPRSGMCGDAVLVGQWVGAEAGFDEKEQVLWIAKSQHVRPYRCAWESKTVPSGKDRGI
jgi:hypothetical protein